MKKQKKDKFLTKETEKLTNDHFSVGNERNVMNVRNVRNVEERWERWERG